MRIGLVGVGRMGRVHARNILADHAVSDLAVLARRPEQAVAAAEELGPRARPCTSLTDLLGSVDGLVVATAVSAHVDFVRAAVRAGVPVLCEKPVSLDCATLSRLRDEVSAAAVPVMVGFQRRFDEGYRALRADVAAGSVGWPYLVRAVAHDRVAPDADYLSTCGGTWWDLLIHELDAVSWVLGERVVEVYARADGQHGAAGAAVAMLSFADGAQGVVTGARRNGQGYDCRIEVFGEQGTIAAGFDRRAPVRCLDPGMPPPGEPHRDFAERFAPAFVAEAAAFLDVVAGRAESPVPLDAALEAARLAAACELSHRLHRPVKVSLTTAAAPRSRLESETWK